MKQTILICFLLIFKLSFSCDICNTYVGLTPNDFKNGISFNYRTRFLKGIVGQPIPNLFKHSGHNVGFENKTVKEIYDVFELRGRYYPLQWLELNLILPYVNNYRSVDQETKYNVWGFGDPILLPRFQLYATKGTDSTKIVHKVMAGAGVKFPLGTIDQSFNGNTVDLDFQPGTGSWDVIFSLAYSLKVKQFVMGLEMNYKLNTANKYFYKYGNTFNTKLDFGYLVGKKFKFLPKLGFTIEQASLDKNKEARVNESGGYILYFNTGFDCFYKGFQFGGEFNLPFQQAFNGPEIPQKYRISAKLAYNF